MTEPTPPDSPKPQFLDYRGSSEDRSKMTGSQIAVGFACWIISVASAVGITYATQSLAFGLIVLALMVAFSTVHFFGQRGYRGFIPGVLIGVAATCLLPLGIVGVICWSKS